ncbi:MAG: hypothetical protein ABUT39_02035 [Acidobacteriota bacterium]
MKVPHLLRVSESPERFASLIEAARAEGLRVGWLELEGEVVPVPESLESAAGLGALRAVAVGAGRTVSVKPLRGAPVLRDLLREHFRGCALVLVRGEVDAPALRPEGAAWVVEVRGFAAQAFDTAELLKAFRSPKSLQGT